ncbi:hypothetical protein BH09PSE6_BH09PSE6_23070 [soil metagenome]
MSEIIVPTPVPPARREPRWLGSRVLAAAIAVVALVAGLLLWRQARELDSVERDFAGRIAEATGRAQAAVQTSNDATNRLGDAQKSLLLLEAKLDESQAQQAALEQLYTELSRNRDEAQLAEVEQSINAAAQQIQLAGNVQAAIAALQTADSRLGRTDKPQFAGVRRAISRDLDRLKAVPNADITGLAVKLDQLISQVDVLPTMSEATPPPIDHGTPGEAGTGAAQPVIDWWSRTVDRIKIEAQQLIRIRQVDAPESLLLSPKEIFFVRENLKLRLLNARLQLLARNEVGFDTDLEVAATMLSRYFDPRARGTASASASLKELRTTRVSVELPNLNDSINAVRNFRPGGPVVPPQR